MLITIRPCQTKDRDDVIALWRACGLVTPQNDPHADFQHKIRFQPDLFLVGLDRDGRLQASVMAGYEGHRGWINYLAVSPAMRRRGAPPVVQPHRLPEPDSAALLAVEHARVRRRAALRRERRFGKGVRSPSSVLRRAPRSGRCS